MNLSEIVKKREEFQNLVQTLTKEKEQLDSETEAQNKSLEQAKRDRDSANEAGDKIAWGNAMDAIAAANKRLNELKTERQKLKVKLPVNEWQPISKAVTPLMQEHEQEIEKHKNAIRELEGERGRIQGLAGQLDVLS
jgi:chromosome segregation ATPase